jgi:dTDP-4-amino-4,6-dideoxygalactose transaminase
MSFVKSMKLINWDDQDIGHEEINSALKSLSRGVGAKGENLELLEKEFQLRLGCKHAILLSNCTTALITSLLALKEVQPNIKKIAVPSFTFIASANAAKFVLDDVELVDCDFDNWNIRVADVPKDVDVIMLVDVGGVPCDYDKFKKTGALLIADSAESLGSTYKGQQIGTQVDLHCFSFQRSKIITSGEGGLITTNDDELAEICRSIVNHGYSTNKKSYEYIHNRFGLNFRMCDIEAAILREQLKKLDFYVQRRNQVAQRYTEKLSTKFKVQTIPDYCQSNYFFYGIMVDPKFRNDMAEYLIDNGIVVKCWTAVHQQQLWKTQGLPNADLISDSIILLPIHNKITDDEVDYIIEKCLEFSNS